MTELLYMQDCYLKEFDAKVVSAAGLEIELDKTAFYPTGGGQPCDKEKIILMEKNFWLRMCIRKKTLENLPRAFGDRSDCYW